MSTDQVHVGDLLSGTIIEYDGKTYRISEVEGGIGQVYIDQYEKFNGKWISVNKMRVAIVDSVLVAYDTLVTIIEESS